MKKILIVHYSMEIGGAESSLLGMLQSIDYSRCKVDLLLLRREGELLSLLPSQVHLLETPKAYRNLSLSIKDVMLQGNPMIAFARVMGRVLGRKYGDRTYNTKQYSHRFALPFLPRLPGQYDLAISYIDPHYIVAKKVNAKTKLSWLHTDFTRIDCNFEQDARMWDSCDWIVNVSESCKAAFDNKHPKLAEKSIVMENILSKSFVLHQTAALDVSAEMPDDGTVRLLSIGRFSSAKNFDNVPDICRRLLEMGLAVKWYLIGYGGDEALIRRKITESGMEEHVMILGKKDNPYPYIAACDLYVQPSRYEGKAVTVREAQMLGKPVVITNYATSASQLEDGVDGIVVPMDNAGCAEGIAALLRSPEKMAQLAENCRERDYSNAQEIEKIYNMME